ncbi:FG-GAP repeat domain-containing protein [Streptomyces sp. DSM 40750]|uniref:FG-GAP repeat domain-containing protein n=1 Tax=Streptomyces sp. DSM 40750 TaxID=2801030 RepID=UPI00214B37D9|nr:VCBS repeat-containing protein [Streptomyces sp. DSM 40750]UUU19172.1 VCBS repeat-containing protein [Streptomyces sp. DSM 40750]UUU27484.1 VCBS repeat-containing protein [Streptomyces sp. DSM 40750]
MQRRSTRLWAFPCALLLVAAAVLWWLEKAASGPGAKPTAGRASAYPDPDDFNGDGFGDPVVWTRSGLTVLYGGANGPHADVRTDVPASASDALARPHPLRADLDDDGFTDLLMATESGVVRVLWGGAEGLSRPVDLSLSTTTNTGKTTTMAKTPPALGDFDGDGSTDLARPGGATGPEVVWYKGPFDRSGRPAARREAAGPHSEEGVPYRVRAGDYGGDDTADLLLDFATTDPESDDPSAPVVSGGTLLLGGEDGPSAARSWAGARPLPRSASGTWSVVFGGYGDDRTLDVLRGGATDPVATFHDLPGLAPGQLTDPGNRGGSTGDVDGDGRLDAVTGAYGANWWQGVVFEVRDVAHADRVNLRSIVTKDVGLPYDAKRTRPSSAQFAPHAPLLDVNGDGRDDLVASTRGKNPQVVFVPGSAEGLDADGAHHFNLAGLLYPESTG